MTIPLRITAPLPLFHLGDITPPHTSIYNEYITKNLPHRAAQRTLQAIHLIPTFPLCRPLSSLRTVWWAAGQVESTWSLNLYPWSRENIGLSLGSVKSSTLDLLITVYIVGYVVAGNSILSH